MKGEITKIDPPKASRNGDSSYIRVYFSLENGKFAKTDLCPTYRNYERWKRFLKVGTKVSNLQLKEVKGITTVNADSFPA